MRLCQRRFVPCSQITVLETPQWRVTRSSAVSFRGNIPARAADFLLRLTASISISLPMILYGIPNCDTVKKARVWLLAHEIDYAFHDFKKLGVDAAWLARVEAVVGWQTLLNTRGTTWRRLDATTRDGVVDAPSALAVMQAHPSVIKRPVLEHAAPSGGSRYHVGFSDAGYQAFFED